MFSPSKSGYICFVPAGFYPRSLPGAVCFYANINFFVIFCVFYLAVIFILRWKDSSLLLIVVCLYDNCCLVFLFFASSLRIVYFFEFLVLFMCCLFMLYVVLVWDITYIEMIFPIGFTFCVETINENLIRR